MKTYMFFACVTLSLSCACITQHEQQEGFIPVDADLSLAQEWTAENTVAKHHQRMIHAIKLSNRANAFRWVRSVLLASAKPEPDWIVPSVKTLETLQSKDDEMWLCGFADGYSYTIAGDMAYFSIHPLYSQETTQSGQIYSDGWDIGVECAFHDIALLNDMPAEVVP